MNVPLATKPRPLQETAPQINRVLLLSALVLLLSLGAWGYQLSQGLIVTNMRNPFSWGLYIATFAFFVGIAAGGLIVSSSVYLFNLEKLKPLTRVASLSAFASTLGAGAMILPDMGRIDRILNLILHPNLRSPLVWDVAVISTYMVVTFLSVYVQLLPEWRESGRGFFNTWTKSRTPEEIQHFSKIWSRRVAMVGLPVAVLIHTVTALIFATQASRGWWNTAILPPDFIAVAVASGTALVMLVSLVVVGKARFTEFQGAFALLAKIVGGALIVHFFFVGVDLLVHGWWGSPESQEIFSLLFGTYAPVYLTELLLPGFTMLFFLTKKGSSTAKTLIFGSVLLFIGVFAHRLMLMFPAFNAIPLTLSLPGIGMESWAYPISVGVLRPGLPSFVTFWAYTPSVFEVVIALLPFALVTFVIALALKLYPFLPVRRG